MRIDRLVGVSLIATGGACGTPSIRTERALPEARSTASQSVVGRWALVSLVRNGEDLTNRVTGASAVRYYTFNVDGTFRITLGDSITETGKWSQDTTVSPRIFDHIPDVEGKPGM